MSKTVPVRYVLKGSFPVQPSVRGFPKTNHIKRVFPDKTILNLELMFPLAIRTLEKNLKLTVLQNEILF